MKTLVTVGAGFIGSCLAEALLARGDDVAAIDNFTENYSLEQKRANVAPMLKNPRFSLHEIDFRDEAAVERVFESFRPDRVAHLGALGNVRKSVQIPKTYVHTNIVGTANLLDAAHRHGAGQFVFASTSSVYGLTDKIPFVETDPTDRPLAPYPATKKACETLGYAYHNMHGTNFTALRFFNVYGPKGRPDMMPFIVLERLIEGREIILFDNGDMKRDWTFIDDILSGVIAALDRPMGYEIVNLGRGEPVLMSDFIRIAEEIAGKKAIIKAEPAPASEPKVTFANVDKARRLLDYAPKTSLAEGLRRFWEWRRSL